MGDVKLGFVKVFSAFIAGSFPYSRRCYVTEISINTEVKYN